MSWRGNRAGESKAQQRCSIERKPGDEDGHGQEHGDGDSHATEERIGKIPRPNGYPRGSFGQRYRRCN